MSALATPVASAQSVSYGNRGCVAGAKPSTFFDPGQSDVVFIAFGDPQYGYELDSNANTKLINAMNAAKGTMWPTIRTLDGTTIASTALTNIRGVIAAGDLTHSNAVTEWNKFAGQYGLCANASLKYPLYEGYGNHDLVDSAATSGKWEPDTSTINAAAVADYVATRNATRPLIGRSAGGNKGHYTWKWGAVTFIQLNLAPTSWARGALSFLDTELDRLGKAPVVIVTHYGFGTWQHEPTDAEQDAYDKVIRDHNVIGHIHGHNHGTSVTVWKAPHPRAASYSVPLFNVGSPLYLDGSEGAKYHGTGDSYIHFTAFRITATHIIACDMRADPAQPTRPAFNPGNWCRGYRYKR